MRVTEMMSLYFHSQLKLKLVVTNSFMFEHVTMNCSRQNVKEQMFTLDLMNCSEDPQWLCCYRYYETHQTVDEWISIVEANVCLINASKTTEKTQRRGQDPFTLVVSN